jgi:hypothetical protein
MTKSRKIIAPKRMLKVRLEKTVSPVKICPAA